MKLQFSLATLLVCMTVLAVVCAVAAVIPVYEETVGKPVVTVETLPHGGKRTIVSQEYSVCHRATLPNIAMRVALWGTPALAAALILLAIGRRENGPPVG
jgi:hypothetical protein